MAVTVLGRAAQPRRKVSGGRLAQKPHAFFTVPSRWMAFFLSLPDNVRDRLFQHLDYTTSCNLAMVCRFFADSMQPWQATLEDKVAAVFHAERYFPQHFPGTINDRDEHKSESQGNLGCFLCHRVRGPEHFDSEQPTTAIMHQANLAAAVRRHRTTTYIRNGMADPIGAMSGVAGLLVIATNLSVGISRRIDAVRGLPRTLQALSTDLKGFVSVLGTLQGYLDHEDTKEGVLYPGTVDELSEVLKDCIQVFNELN
ncbi:hypothetical protein ACHAQH_006324 [Verticillium albo-atrum]